MKNSSAGPTSSGGDHRFTEKWPKAMQISSWSKSFDHKDDRDWIEKLKMVHDHCWRTWKKIKDDKNYKKFDLRLPDGKQEQTGGVIPPDVVQNLKPVISRLPPKRK